MWRIRWLVSCMEDRCWQQTRLPWDLGRKLSVQLRLILTDSHIAKLGQDICYTTLLIKLLIGWLYLWRGCDSASNHEIASFPAWFIEWESNIECGGHMVVGVSWPCCHLPGTWGIAEHDYTVSTLPIQYFVGILCVCQHWQLIFWAALSVSVSVRALKTF